MAALNQKIAALNPELVIISGDLTIQNGVQVPSGFGSIATVICKKMDSAPKLGTLSMVDGRCDLIPLNNHETARHELTWYSAA